MENDRWRCDVDEKLDDHEGRIRKVENSSTVLETKLNMMIAILGAIAVMVGGGLIKLIF